VPPAPHPLHPQVKQAAPKIHNQVPHPNQVPVAPNPPQSGSELDGLAALVAARIRTKAELKQVKHSSACLAQCPPWSYSLVSNMCLLIFSDGSSLFLFVW